MARIVRRLPLVTRRRVPAISVGLDHRSVDSKALAADQPFRDAPGHRLLEQFAKNIALTETTVPVFGKGRMIRHRAFQPEPAEPSICEVEVDLVAQPALGADPQTIADDQHPDHQLGIDRWSTGVAIERPELLTNLAQVHEPVDRSEQVVRWNMSLQVETVE